jgi:hypothetical protein
MSGCDEFLQFGFERSDPEHPAVEPAVVPSAWPVIGVEEDLTDQDPAAPTAGQQRPVIDPGVGWPFFDEIPDDLPERQQLDKRPPHRKQASHGVDELLCEYDFCQGLPIA